MTLNVLSVQADVVAGKIQKLPCIVCKSVHLLEGHTKHLYLCACFNCCYECYCWVCAWDWKCTEFVVCWSCITWGGYQCLLEWRCSAALSQFSYSYSNGSSWKTSISVRRSLLWKCTIPAGEAGGALRAMRGNKAWAFIVPANQWVGWALALMSVQNCV